jgi:hypothetical protein
VSEQQTETPKRGPGRPKKRNAVREPLRKPVHSGRDDDPDRIEKYEFHPFEAHDKFHVSRDDTEGYRLNTGRVLMWVARECMGKALDDYWAARIRNQWDHVRAGEDGGRFDRLGIKDGVIAVENIFLMSQPEEINRKARAYEKRQANAAVTRMRESHATEGIDVPMPGGGAHESALRQNRHRSSYEKSQIPD